METIDLLDLHCDTAKQMLELGQPLGKNEFAVSLEQAAGYRQYIQVMALFTDRRLSDTAGWERLLQMYENLKSDPSVQGGRARLVMACPPRAAGISLLLGVEDARILQERLERVDMLYQMGIRILTPLWQGNTCIGGAHDTENGLTAFGKLAVQRAVALGMLADISHASVRAADEMLEISAVQGRPVIASHSNAYACCSVSRNLRDGQIRAIVACKGLIGLNLYTEFLSCNQPATVDDLLRHTEHFLSLGAAQALCLGCDMDGARLPQDLHSLSALPSFANCLLRHNYPEQLVRAIFFENAYRVLQATLGA